MARTSTCDSVFPPHVGDARLTPGQALSGAPVHFVQYSSNLTIRVTVRHLANQVDILDIGRLANRGSWLFHLLTPTPLQFGGDPTVAGVDDVVLLKRPLGLILQLLELSLENHRLAILFRVDALDRFQTGLDPVWRNHIQQLLRKTAVHRRPAKTDSIQSAIFLVSFTKILRARSAFSQDLHGHLL